MQRSWTQIRDHDQGRYAVCVPGQFRSTGAHSTGIVPFCCHFMAPNWRQPHAMHVDEDRRGLGCLVAPFVIDLVSPTVMEMTSQPSQSICDYRAMLIISDMCESGFHVANSESLNTATRGLASGYYFCGLYFFGWFVPNLSGHARSQVGQPNRRYRFLKIDMVCCIST